MTALIGLNDYISDANLHSLPDPNLSHSYSISTFSSKSNGVPPMGNSQRKHSSSLTPSVRHMSESLTNLHLNNKNNNHATASCIYSANNVLNNNHLVSGANTNGNALNNSQNSTLSHAISLSGLNHLKPDHLPTFPSLSSPKPHLVASSHYPSHNASTPLTPIGQIGVASGNTITSNKITSVVRPVINDASRPIAQTVHPQQKVSSLYSDNTFRNSVTNLENIFNKTTTPVRERSNTASNDSTFIIPETQGHSAGLDFNEFLPKHIQQFGYDHHPYVSEMEAINSIMKGHKAAKAGLDYRRKQVQIVLAMWATKDSKTALEYVVNLDEKSIVIDILNVMILKA